MLCDGLRRVSIDIPPCDVAAVQIFFVQVVRAGGSYAHQFQARGFSYRLSINPYLVQYNDVCVCNPTGNLGGGGEGVLHDFSEPVITGQINIFADCLNV